MRIIIEADKKEEKDIKRTVYNGVVEFALSGTLVEGEIIPKPFNRTHGDTFVLYGKLAELQERLRKLHDGKDTK